jgi:two-component system nitrate/nitrite response regulator NarL
VKVLIADDHKLVLEGLKLYLNRKRPDLSVLCALSFDEAAVQADEIGDLDAAILDLYMPGMDGLRGLRTMRDKHPELPVLIMSGLADSATIREALRSGAAGFIVKDLPGRSMISALELALAGEIYVPPMALDDLPEPGAEPCSPDWAVVPPGGNPLRCLSERETQVLTNLVVGMSNKEIARRMGISAPTVSYHLTRMFRKLGVTRRTEAVSKALRLGFKV